MHESLNVMFNGRLYLSKIALQNNGIKILGHYVEVIPWSVAGNFLETNAIDNAYVFTLVHYGYIVFGLVMFGTYSIYKHAVEKGDHCLCICILFVILIGFIEHQIFNVGSNAFLLMLTSAVFKSKEKTTVKRKGRAV